jgi:hypothetical protein
VIKRSWILQTAIDNFLRTSGAPVSWMLPVRRSSGSNSGQGATAALFNIHDEDAGGFRAFKSP